MKSSFLAPWLILTAGLVLTYMAQDANREAARRALHDEFELRAEEIVQYINRRMGSYEQVLEGVAGLFAASDGVDRRAFAGYVAALGLEGKYPGIQGVGFSLLVRPPDKPKHVARMRSGGFPRYDIRPAGERETYTSIVYLEPFDWRNQRAFGYDMYSEPVRRLAMQRSWDEDAPVISGKVKLVQETDQDVQPGFLMYLPVYGQRLPHRTSEERRANLMGWVYAPFRMNDLVGGMLDRWRRGTTRLLDLEIYDGNTIGADALLFDSGSPTGQGSPQFRSVRQLMLFGRPWTVVAHSLPEFDGRLNYEKANIIALAGTGGSALLALVAWLLVTGRARAQALAASMTVELRKSETGQRKLNRALRLLSDCNTALIHAQDENRLLTDVCRLCVEHGGYLMAWVGYGEQDEERSVRPIAKSGYENDYLDGVKITWSDTELGQGPTGTAIRTGMASINSNVLTNPRMGPWRDAAARRGYRSSIALPLTLGDRILGALTIYAGEPDAFDAEELHLLAELAADLSFGIATLRGRAVQRESARKLEKALSDTIRAIATTIEARDPYTAGHQRRVAELAAAIGREMGLDDDRVMGILRGSEIHDIGKVSVPVEILARPGRLSAMEFDIIKIHPRVGYDIIKDVDFPWPVREMVLQHHERGDGSGYPQGLTLKEIVLEARILAVADVVDAMISHRPYRVALGQTAALAEIETNRGRLYDPAAVDACLRLFRESRFAFSTLRAP
ncbi:MAG TPA: CHASE domain-containing protein [Rhodocyclaceae bacterium]